MNKDYTYCSQSHNCPKRKQCKRHIRKHPSCFLWWIDLEHKTKEDFLNCEMFDLKIEKMRPIEKQEDTRWMMKY